MMGHNMRCPCERAECQFRYCMNQRPNHQFFASCSNVNKTYIMCNNKPKKQHITAAGRDNL